MIVLGGCTSADDVDRAAALVKTATPKITSIHRFPRNSMSRPDAPPIFVEPGLQAIQPPVINVFEIKNRTEQDKVIAAVQTVMRDQKLKRVDLQFMDHENWIVDGNVGKRGPELQLRRVRISQGRVQEDGGEKTITYLPKELQ
jgi:hypothetical protein